VKNPVFLLSSVLLAGAAAASAQTATSPTRIGVINIQQAIVSTSDGQKAVKDLEDKSAPKKKELERMQGEINALRDQLNKMSSVGSEEQKRKLMGEIDAKTKSFNRQVEDAQAELDQDQGRVLNELGGRMLAVLDKYAKDNGYAVVLDISSQQTPVLFAANGIDVTREVVDLYNKNAPAAAPAGAPSMMRQPSAPPGAVRPGSLPPSRPAAPKPGAVK
jgi:outer membrane protein